MRVDGLVLYIFQKASSNDGLFKTFIVCDQIIINLPDQISRSGTDADQIGI